MGRKDALLIQLALGCLALGLAQGYAIGGPDTQCSTNKPNHGVTTQSSAAPYNITAPSMAYYGSSINVTLTGTNVRTMFKGFYIYAVNINGIKQGEFALSTQGAQLVLCNGMNNTATHTSGSDKNSVTLSWKSTFAYPVNVTFMATVVQSKLVYWTGLQGATVSIQPMPNTTTMPTTTITQPANQTPTTTHPGMTPPTTTQPGMAPPTTTQPGMTPPTTTQPGMTPPTTTQPGMTPPTTTQPGMAPPTTTQPGMTPPTTTQPGMTPPTTTQPGMTPPTTTQPGMTPPTTTQPGMAPPTTTQPGTAPPTTTAIQSTTAGVGKTGSSTPALLLFMMVPLFYN